MKGTSKKQLQLSILKGCTCNVEATPVHILFENIARGDAQNNPALIFEEHGITKTHTYAELDAITNRTARALVEIVTKNNLQPNSDGDYVVTVNLVPSDKLLILLLSILKAGMTYLPFDKDFPKSKIDYIIDEVEPVINVFESGTDVISSSYGVTIEDLLEETKNYSDKNLSEDERVEPMHEDKIAFIYYTSGSTGTPKGVRLPHSALINRLQWKFKALPWTPTEKICVFKTTLTFIDSVCEIWAPLVSGLALLILSKSASKNPEELVGALEKYKVERITLVPTLLKTVLAYLNLLKKREGRILLQNLKLWIYSGEPIPVVVVEEFFDYFNENTHVLCGLYGSTEVMGDVTVSKPLEVDLLKKQRVPPALPIDNTIIYLLDKNFRPVKLGESGEIFVSGLNVAYGYVKGQNNDKFFENPFATDLTYLNLYRSGDYGKIVNGFLLLEGRVDSQIKVRGQKVNLLEIESEITKMEGVSSGVVLCYNPGEIDQTILAFIITSMEKSETDIETELKSRLTSYMVPQVVIIDHIPLLNNGKVDKQSLLNQFKERFEIRKANLELGISYENVPKDKMEAARDLFETVSSVLNQSIRSVISVDSNFYEVGGNSLNSVITISKLAEKGYNISITDFISSANFGELLERMSNTTYYAEPAQPEHKDIIKEMVVYSLYEKGSLDRYIKSEVSLTDYETILLQRYEFMLEKNLSFVAKSSTTNEIVGVSINYDITDEPQISTDTRLIVLFEVTREIARAVAPKLPQGSGKVLHTFFVTTHPSVSSRDNVGVIHFLETEVIRLAEKRGFRGIFAMNVNELTQQLATNVFKYETLMDYQLNTFVASDKTRPFKDAPDSQRILAQWKPLK